MGHTEHGGTPVADLFTESPASMREKLDNFPKSISPTLFSNNHVG